MQKYTFLFFFMKGATHSNSNPKNDVKLTWKPTENFMGKLKFKYAEFSIFYSLITLIHIYSTYL